MSGRRDGRSVPAMYGAVSLVLVAGALTFALSSPPPSTPPLASVAPAPQENIEVERVEQSSRFGEGSGGEGECPPGESDCRGPDDGASDAADAPTPPAPTSDPDVSRATFRPCYNSPKLTQSPDPQSPACRSEVFQGDNGGSTWVGVTGDTIRIAVPVPIGASFANHGGDDAHAKNRQSDLRVLRAIADHVEEYYELYGRRLELVEVERPEDDGPAADRSFARTVAAVEPFAVLEYADGSIPFYEAISEQGVVALEPGEVPVADRDVYDRFHPFVWGVYPSVEQAGAATGDLICTALMGRPARHAGEQLAQTTRSFAVVVEQRSSRSVPPDALTRSLESCGAPHRTYPHAVETDDAEVLVRRLAQDGHTSVVCLCQSPIGRYSQPATAIGYHPEWVTSGLLHHAASQWVLQMDRPQRDNVFGLWPGLRQPARSQASATVSYRWEDFYWYRAITEQDPDVVFDRLNPDVGDAAYRYYAQFLILASGIQAAGPELTPHTFGEGLLGQQFPNPGVGAAPWFQPAVGFGPGDHTLNSDVALAWWNNTTEQEEQARRGRGAYCYVDGGARFVRGTFPSDADGRLFDPEAGCR